MVSTRYNLCVHPGIHPWATGKWHGSTHFWLEHPGLWGKVKGSILKLSYSLEKPTQTLMLNVHSNHNLQTVLCILSIPFSNWNATPPLTPLSAFRHASLTRYVLQYKIKYASAPAKLKCYIRSWNCRELQWEDLLQYKSVSFYKSLTSDKGAGVVFFLHFFF